MRLPIVIAAAAIVMIAVTSPALSRSPFGGVNDLVRKARQVEKRVNSTINRETHRVRPVPNPNPVVKPGPKPFPVPNPVIKPGPQPRPIPNPIIDPLPGPIILPGPGPLPRPQPHPDPVDAPITPPCPRPVIVTNPRPCPAPRPEPIVDDLPVLHEAQTVNVPVDGLGRAGRVVIKLGPILASAKVIAWGPETVVFEVPTVGLANTAPATLELLTDDGRRLASIDFDFAPYMPAAAQIPQVPAGSRLTLNGDDFGSQPGSVWVQIGQIRLHATVLTWTATEAVVQLPEMELANPAPAELVVADQSGVAIDRSAIELVAAR